MRLLAALALLITAPACAAAQPARVSEGIPTYDVEARCRQFQKGAEGICIDAEQRDYDLSRMLWDGLSSEQQAKCASFVGQPGPRRYGAVQGCVTLYSDMNDIKRRQATTKFRY